MLRDEKAGKLVNLTVTDEPQDIYQVIADNVREDFARMQQMASHMHKLGSTMVSNVQQQSEAL